MAPFFLIWMSAAVLVVFGLYRLGKEHVKGSFAERPGRGVFEKRLPRVSLIVPLTGDSPVIRASLESLLKQTYPDFEVVFATCGPEDPASKVAGDAAGTAKNARHVFSEKASRCSQKNQNLLAGLAAADKSSEILAFCDSTHIAPPNFLADLASPIIRGEALMTTGFHRVVPQDMGFATLGMLVSVAAIHLMQAAPTLVQPWGGATAICRRTFEGHGIDSLWAQNFVDDLSMGTLLAKAGIRARAVSSACLLTPLSGVTLGGWHDWLRRQIFYLKYCQPPIWAGAGAAILLAAAPPAAGVALACGLFGKASPAYGVSGSIFLAAFCALGLKWRTLTPQKVPIWRWLPAFFAAGLMAAACYVSTWRGNVLEWRSISYRVGRGGRVEEVIKKIKK